MDAPTDLRAEARSAAEEWATDPSTVVEFPHAGFNADPVSGGVAFLCDRGLVIHEYAGSKGWSVDPGDDPARVAKIEQTWAAARHRHRELRPDELGPLHRAAVAALASGAPSVGEVELPARPGVADGDLPRADHLLVHLQRRAKEPTEAAALRVFAANDWLLAEPAADARAHACPICGRPALGGPRYPSAVCDRCKPKTLCSHGRVVSGHNVSFSGGFAAVHTEDDRPCEQVTADGRCWIEGALCDMREARFGGVVVSAVTGASPVEQAVPGRR